MDLRAVQLHPAPRILAAHPRPEAGPQRVRAGVLTVTVQTQGMPWAPHVLPLEPAELARALPESLQSRRKQADFEIVNE